MKFSPINKRLCPTELEGARRKVNILNIRTHTKNKDEEEKLPEQEINMVLGNLDAKRAGKRCLRGCRWNKSKSYRLRIDTSTFQKIC